MPGDVKITLSTALMCAALLMGCGGGGGSSSPPPPPPPPPGAPQPLLYIEADPNGALNLRVIERVYDAFAPATPQRTFSNLTASPGDIDGSQTTLVSNVHVTQEKYGIHILGSGVVSINDYSYVGFDGGGSIHGAAIKLERSTGAATYVQRVFADGQQAPDPTYTVSNTDFLGVEFNSGPIYMRGATGRNFGDGGVDTKSTGIYLMNVTLDGANRMLRAWGGTEITLVNAIINAPTNSTQAWIYDNTASVRYYNVLWCVGATDPAPGVAGCSNTPTVVDGENISDTDAMARMIALPSNPLPAVSPFFASDIDRIVVEYSSNGGSTWQAMNLPNAGGGGQAPIGDTRYRIPLNLAAADYLFRAYFEKNGVKVGNYSAIINEAGQVVG